MFLDTEDKEDFPTLPASLKVKKATIEKVWGNRPQNPSQG